MTTPESIPPAEHVTSSHVRSREAIMDEQNNTERAERFNHFVQRLGETGILKARIDTEVTPDEPDERLADRLGS